MKLRSHSLSLLFISWTATWSLYSRPGAHALNVQIQCVWDKDPNPKVSDYLDRLATGTFAEHCIRQWSVFECYIKPSSEGRLTDGTEYCVVAYSITQAAYDQYIHDCDGLASRPANVRRTELVAYVWIGGRKNFIVQVVESRIPVQMVVTQRVNCYVWLGFKNDDEKAAVMCIRQTYGGSYYACWIQSYGTAYEAAKVTGIWSGKYFMVPNSTYELWYKKCTSRNHNYTMIGTSTRYYCFWNMDAFAQAPCYTSIATTSRKKTLRLQNTWVGNPPEMRPRKQTGGKKTQTKRMNQNANSRRSNKNVIAGRRRRVKRAPYCVGI